MLHMEPLQIKEALFYVPKYDFQEMTPFFSNTENSSVLVKGGFPMCQHCCFGSIGITRFYLDNITIGDELGLKTFGAAGELFQGLSRKPDAIMIIDH